VSDPRPLLTHDDYYAAWYVTPQARRFHAQRLTSAGVDRLVESSYLGPYGGYKTVSDLYICKACHVSWDRTTSSNICWSCGEPGERGTEDQLLRQVKLSEPESLVYVLHHEITEYWGGATCNCGREFGAWWAAGGVRPTDPGSSARSVRTAQLAARRHAKNENRSRETV